MTQLAFAVDLGVAQGEAGGGENDHFHWQTPQEKTNPDFSGLPEWYLSLRPVRSPYAVIDKGRRLTSNAHLSSNGWKRARGTTVRADKVFHQRTSVTAHTKLDVHGGRPSRNIVKPRAGLRAFTASVGEVVKVARPTHVHRAGIHHGAAGRQPAPATDDAAAAATLRFPKDEATAILHLPIGQLHEDFRRSRPKRLLKLSGWCVQDGDVDVIARVNGRVCVTLELRRCTSLTDHGLKHLAAFSAMTHLALDGCPHLTDKTMDLVRSKLYRLRYLSLSDCSGITDAGISVVMAACRVLEELHLANVVGLMDDGIKGICEGLRMHRALRVLDLSRSTHFSNESLLLMLQDGGGVLKSITLAGCSQVHELGLMGLRRSGRSSLSMTALDVSSTRISDPAVRWIAEGCKHLERLDLGGNSGLQDAAVLYLVNAPMRLKWLSLHGCRLLTDYGIEPMVTSPVAAKLEHLDIAGCAKLTDTTMVAIGRCCRALQELNLEGVVKYTDHGLCAIAKGCPALQSVDLSVDLSYLDTSHTSRMPRYTSQGVEQLAKSCTQLRSVRLQGANKVEDAAIAALAKCADLRSLVMRWCYSLTDEALVAVAQGCEKLQHVSIGGCTYVTDAGIEAIAKGSGAHLRYLETSSCRSLTDRSMAALGEHAPQLEHLDVRGCDKITDAGVRSFVSAVANRGPRASRLQTLILRGLNEITPACLHGMAAGLPSLTELDVSNTTLRSDHLKKLADKMPYTMKGEGNVLVPVSESVRLYNLWLMEWRRRSAAATKVNNLVRRFLHRCHYYRFRGLLNCCATLIQRVYRGHRGRKLFNYLSVLNTKGPRCASKVQALYRGILGRRRAAAARLQYAHWRSSATTIQASVRCMRGVRLYRAKLRWLGEVARCWEQLIKHIIRRHHQHIVREAAVRIGKAWRALKWRKLEHAAVDIQRVWRGHNARRKLWRERCIRLFTTHRAATKVAAAYRNHRRRWSWRVRLKEIRISESFYRDMYKRRREAALRIQKAYGSMHEWHEYLRNRPPPFRFSRSARKIQSLIRGFLARGKVQVMRRALRLHTQKVLLRWRDFISKIYKHKATIIQRAWRRVMKRHRAAICIQTVYRGYAGRQHRRRLVLERRFKLVATFVHVTRAYLLLSTHLTRGRSANRLQIWFHRYRIRKLWKLASRAARQRLYEAKQLEKRQKVAAAQRALAVRKTEQKDDQAARRIQRTWAAYQARKRTRHRMRLAEEARRTAARERLENEEREREELEARKSPHFGVTKLLTGVTSVLKSSTAQDKPDGPEAVMRSIKGQAKKARERGAKADEQSRKMKEQMDTQADAALIKYHTRAAETSGIVGFKITVGATEKTYLEKATKLDKTLPQYKCYDVDLSGINRQHVYLFYLTGEGPRAFRHLSLHPLPPGLQDFEHEMRVKSLASVGVDVFHHHLCRMEIHGHRDSYKQDRGLPIDDIKLTGSVAEEAGLSQSGWKRLEPKLKNFGLGGAYLWVHSMTKTLAEQPEANLLTEGFIGGFAWYDARLKRTMEAYALAADDILHMHEIFVGMDHRGEGVISILALYDYLDERESVFGEWAMASISARDTRKLCFSEFVNLAAMLCMFDTEDTKRFVFGMLDTERNGHVAVNEFTKLLDELAKTNPKLPPHRLKKLFLSHTDSYRTVTFDKFAVHIAVGPVLWPLERLMAKIREKVLGNDFWMEQKLRFVEARERLQIKKRLTT